MVTEPADAPVPDRSKKRYYIAFALLVVIGAALAFFVLPNLYFMTSEGPAVEEGFRITVPTDEGLVRVDPTE